jgi:hypothetical protein
MISEQINEEKTATRSKYLEELRQCVLVGVASKSLGKMANQLGYGSRKINEDEQNLVNFLELKKRQDDNTHELIKFDNDFKQAFGELRASNEGFVAALKSNNIAKMSFLLMQNHGDRLLSEKLRLEQEIEVLNEYR